ncbi:hypothetical protein SUGI_0702140 [Cryptomeria japonica]|uniref:U-box domain-containing protein 33 n=1 Tax=Cryptomeria japonica TaxID=3369 RepID=UPI00241489B3|nr:U-box domain-containing protein 33 [Cryptomeria japonica]GLJ34875.1 hypothetical protein SUGI_0702140 [Cryptomeria japonica]
MAATGEQGDAQVTLQTEIEEIIPIQNPPLQQKIYVAVGKDLCESANALKWLLQKLDNTQAAFIILLHIQCRPRYMPSAIGKIPLNEADEDHVKVYMKDLEKELKICLDKYLQMCTRFKVKAEPLVVEKNDVSKGIVEVVSELGITKLIMGTTSASGGIIRSNLGKMKMIAPGKADYVRRHAIETCDLWIVCKDKLVSHNARKFKGHKSPCPDDFGKLLASAPNFQLNLEICNRNPSIFQVSGNSTPVSVSEIFVDFDELVSSESEVADTPAIDVDEGCSHGTIEPEAQRSQDIEAFINQLREALEASKKAKTEAQREAANRKNAEAATVRANQRFASLETAFNTTMREKEEATSLLKLVEEKWQEFTGQPFKVEENLEAMFDKLNQISRERQEAIHELEAGREKLAAMEEQIKYFQDCLNSRPQIETPTTYTSSSSNNLEFREYSFNDIKAATYNFSDNLKLGEGTYAAIYKGEIRKTIVTVKILKKYNLYAQPQFHRETKILKDIRHPNLVRALGTCFEQRCIINEYISNGCLADHLTCKSSAPPLPWQARIRIAAEVCSALQYLHSLKPDPIVHGDLRPQNILLDENFTSKISDFDLPRPLPHVLFSRSEIKGTHSYLDPEYLKSAGYSTKSDVYSLGIIILQLLTGKRALGLVKEVEYALENGKLELALDPSAGNWPFVQATQLAYLALHCADPVGNNRPGLQPTVMKMLDQLSNMAVPEPYTAMPVERDQSATPVEHDQTSEKLPEETRIPSLFICPIFQEVMEDPCVAADGFTYEREAIQGWLDCGKDTSPMTNKKLEKKNLIANFSLRSAIRQWQEKGDLL